MNKPSMELIRNSDPIASETVHRLNTDISLNPRLYIGAIRQLGRQALGFMDVRPASVSGAPEAEGQINHFFNAGVDQMIEFDEETEDALANDPNHQELIRTLRKQKTIDSHEGVMKTVRRENPRAAIARDAVRWSRLLHFADRIEDWYALQATADLKSAS